MSLLILRYCLLVTVMPVYGLFSAPPNKAPATPPKRPAVKQAVKATPTKKTVTVTPRAPSPAKLITAKATPADAARSAAAIQAALIFPESKKGGGAGTWESAMVEVVASGRGRIDYEQGFARAVGLGALPPPSLTRSRAQDALDARDAALADALRTLGMAVQQVRVDARTRVSNYTLKSDDVRVKLGAVVKNAEVVEETFLKESGIWRVVVQTPLTGAGSVAEAVGTTLAPVATPTPTPTPTPAPTPEPDPYAPGAPPPAGCEYTGLIIDCRGLGVIPCRAPKLRDGRGVEVYGTMQIDPDFVDEFGIVSYPRNMGEARRSGSRAGSRPLIIRARRAGSDRTNPIISDSDARDILDANARDHFLERTAVMFVVD